MPEVKNILVVRKHNQIGDMLSSLPLYAALKKKYPSASITLVASQTNYPIPFSEINPYIDEVLIYDKTSVWTIMNFYRRLRKKKFDIGIVPSTIRLSRSSHIINYFSSAQKRVGVNSIDGISNKSASLLNIKGDFNWEGERKHQSERNYDIAKLAGCMLSEAEKNITLPIKNSIKKEALKFNKENFPDDAIIIGIHPGAGKEANMWNDQKFIEVIERIYNSDIPGIKKHLQILITSGEIDKAVTENVFKVLNEKGLHCRIALNFPVLKLAAVLGQIKLYITNDTGTMHIAGKTNVNQISLFGPTNIYEWAPVGINKINIQSPSKNINDIEVSTVTSAALTFLK